MYMYVQCTVVFWLFISEFVYMYYAGFTVTEHWIQRGVLQTTPHNPTLLGSVSRIAHPAEKEVLM